MDGDDCIIAGLLEVAIETLGGMGLCLNVRELQTYPSSGLRPPSPLAGEGTIDE